MATSNSEKRPVYSVSGLMAYETCPWQYYYSFVRHYPPPITSSMRRGTSVHKVIADSVRHPELIPESVPEEVAPLADAFRQSRFAVPAIATEKRFVLPFEQADVRGRIDLIVPREPGLEVVDFKSGNGAGRNDLKDSLQLPIYALATSKLFDLPADLLHYTYFYLGDATEISFAASEAGFAQLTERIDSLIANIGARRFDPRPGCTCYACEARRTRRGRSIRSV
ncbi:MAG TPA: PD-(D/E)XK nuclease family protein [Chloroflexota bacterium]|nr:PD-(D/E)XK nuclease family protein [Chloroflexota bacterium]